MIGEQIKKFRSQKSMTQEELGRRVGVTTQAVSKWERGGVPDAEIIPNIADALGVSIDALYGRIKSESTEDIITHELSSLHPENGFKKAFSILWSVSLGLSGVSSVKDSFGSDVVENLNDHEGHGYYSRLCIDEGIINARMNTDSRYFFLMPEPKNGYAQFFENIDELAETFSLFGDKDILKILFYMYSRQNIPIALSLIASKTKTDIKKTEQLMEKLCEKNLANCSVIETENGNIKAYTFFNETVVIPLLCHAKEIRDKKVINWGVWFNRNKPLF